MIPAVAGSCQYYDNAKHYNIQNFMEFATNNDPKGLNFLFGKINDYEMGWMTGIRVALVNGNPYMFISNRGNNNQTGYDTDNTYIARIPMYNTDGLYDQVLSVPVQTSKLGNTINGENTISGLPGSFEGVEAGQSISGTGIPGGTFVSGIDALRSVVTMTNNATADNTSASFTFAQILTSCDGFDVDPTGTHWIWADFNGGGARSMVLETEYDLESAPTYSQVLNNTGAGTRAVSWNNDGSKYYCGKGVTASSSEVRQYTAATPYQTSSGDSEDVNSPVSFGFSAIADITFNADGSKIYLTQHTGHIWQYDLGTEYDVTSVDTFSGVDWDLTIPTNYFINASDSPVRTSGTTPYWLCGGAWNSDGTKFYVATLWGQIGDTNTSNSPSPSTVAGNGGTVGNTFAALEFSYK